MPDIDATSHCDELPLRILVVDDDSGMRRGLRIRLESAGYEVFEAACGKTAIELFSQQPMDLVIQDVNIPDMDGFEVCKSMRQLKDVPVIFLTGEQGQIIRDHMDQMVKAVGGQYYLGKPCDSKILLKLISELLQTANQSG